MSFTYNVDTNPAVFYPRLLIPDRVQNPSLGLPVFSDEEIMAFYTIQAAQFQSSMFFSPPAGRNLPMSPLSYLRVAALGIDVIANDTAQAAIIVQMMDIKLNGTTASQALAARADNYRKIDDESGAFVVIEQVFTGWGFIDRYWKQVQRQTGGGGGIG